MRIRLLYTINFYTITYSIISMQLNAVKNGESCACSEVDQLKIGETSCGCMMDKPEKESDRSRGLNIVKAPRIYRERRPVKGEVVTIIDVSFNSSGIDLADLLEPCYTEGGDS